MFCHYGPSRVVSLSLQAAWSDIRSCDIGISINDKANKPSTSSREQMQKTTLVCLSQLLGDAPGTGHMIYKISLDIYTGSKQWHRCFKAIALIFDWPVWSNPRRA